MTTPPHITGWLYFETLMGAWRNEQRVEGEEHKVFSSLRQTGRAMPRSIAISAADITPLL